MNHALDLATGLLCLVICGAFSTLFAATSPSHKRWFPLPFYLRVCVFTTMTGMLYRGVELITTLARAADDVAPGHIDRLGFLLTISMACTITGLAVYAWRNRHTAAVLERLAAAGEVERDKAHGEALGVLVLEGATVAAPLAPPAALKPRSRYAGRRRIV
jgi:hypothetical protein